ncbi:MAG: metal-sensitive transcriptional regulator [Bacillota bacterium]|nr:metal-sensitive transcriptional regulator [Bacillota bacterium]
MTLDEQLLKELMARMRRIEGQARGVQRMLQEGRSCEEIVTQLSALRSAVSKVAVEVMTANLEECLQGGAGSPSHEALEHAREIFLRFA